MRRQITHLPWKKKHKVGKCKWALSCVSLSALGSIQSDHYRNVNEQFISESDTDSFSEACFRLQFYFKSGLNSLQVSARTCQISAIVFQNQNIFSPSHCSITRLFSKQDGDEGVIILLLGLWFSLAIRRTQSSNQMICILALSLMLISSPQEGDIFFIPQFLLLLKQRFSLYLHQRSSVDA